MDWVKIVFCFHKAFLAVLLFSIMEGGIDIYSFIIIFGTSYIFWRSIFNVISIIEDLRRESARAIKKDGDQLQPAQISSTELEEAFSAVTAFTSAISSEIPRDVQVDTESSVIQCYLDSSTLTRNRVSCVWKKLFSRTLSWSTSYILHGQMILLWKLDVLQVYVEEGEADDLLKHIDNVVSVNMRGQTL